MFGYQRREVIGLVNAYANLTAKNIIIWTDSFLSTKAVSDGKGGGFVAVGSAKAKADGDNESRINIETYANLTATENISVLGKTDTKVNAKAVSGNGGFIGVAKADADAILKYDTRVDVNGNLTAGNVLT